MSDPGLRRLANRVLWPGFIGPGTPDWVRRECEDGLAGVVLFAGNISEAGCGEALDLPEGVLVGIDEEGGTVTRLDAVAGSAELGAAQLGALDDVALTRRTARRLARRAAGAGANVLVGPVADVNTDPLNPVIGSRAFGADPQLVSRHAAAWTAGAQDAGAVAMAKHFPGHGDTATDTHHGRTVSRANLRDQEELHLAPFAAAIAAGTRAIMTGHLEVPGWSDRPATAAPGVLARLRERGFEGVIVSDALDMGAMQARFGAGSPAVALAAGCDLLCVGNPENPGSSGDDEGDLHQARESLLRALAEGRLTIARLEEAAARVDALARQATSPHEILAGDDGGDDGDDDGGGDPALRLEQAVRAARKDGRAPALPGSRLVVDARGEANMAAGRTGVGMLEELARGGRVLPAGALAGSSGSEGASGSDGGGLGGPGGDAVVVLVDRLALPAQQAAVRQVVDRLGELTGRGATTAAGMPVVVNLGVLPPAPETLDGLPAVHVLATSRLAVQAADRLLESGWG